MPIKSLPGVFPVRSGATVRSAFRHPSQVTYGLLRTKQKPTFSQGDNLRKYIKNQFSSFVGDKTVMENYGIIICVPFVKIIYAHRVDGGMEMEKEMEKEQEMGYLRFLRREVLRWERRDVITMAACLFQILASVIVRRLVRYLSEAEARFDSRVLGKRILNKVIIL